MVSIRIRRKDVVKATVAFFILMVLALMAAVRPAYAANITVTTATDELNGTDAGACASGSVADYGTDISLREAICIANNNGEADTITLPASSGPYTLTIAGTGEDDNVNGDLDITSPITIRGNGNIVQACDQARDSAPGNLNSACSGNGIEERVFEIRNIPGGSTVILRDMTIQRGRATGGNGDSNRGGGVYKNSSPGSVELQFFGVTITDNYAAEGGAISQRNDGSILVFESTLSDNQANDGGAYHNGGTNTLAIRRSTVSGNFTTSGTGTGGIRASTNTFGRTTLIMTETTVSGNTGTIGGVHLVQTGGAFIIRRSTIGANTGIGLALQSLGNSVTLANTLVVGNTTDCSFPVNPVTSGSNNLSTETDATCTVAASFTANIDITAPDADVDTTLQNNGGPTDTHALLFLTDNPALDTGGSCPNPVDQRSTGFPREVDLVGVGSDGSDFCDVGAFELGVYTVTTFPTATSIVEQNNSANIDLNLTTVPTGQVEFVLTNNTPAICTVPGTVVAGAGVGSVSFTVTSLVDDGEDGPAICDIDISIGAGNTNDDNYDSVDPDDVVVTILEDDFVEDDGTLLVPIQLPSIAASAVTFTVVSNDTTECDFTDANPTIGVDSSFTTASVDVIDDTEDDGDQTCDITVAYSSGDATFNAFSQVFTFNILDNDDPADDDDGGDEDEDDGEDAPEAVASGPVVDEGTGLSLDIVAQPSVISGPGDEVVFTVTVTNGSNAAIDPGQLTTTIPEQFSIASATPSQGEAQVVGQQVFLQSGEIGAGASVTVTIPTTFNGGAATLPNGAAAQTDSSQFTATATVSGLSDTATVRILPGELPATGGQPVREVPIAAVAAVALALIAGGFALRVRRRTV